MTPLRPSLADRYFAVEPRLIAGLLALSGGLAAYLALLLGQSAGW
jgi:hypothetical protein